MKKKISLQEVKSRTKEFKEKIYYLKKCNIRVYYEPKITNDIIFLERDEFESLLRNLESFEMTLIKDKRLEKFQYSLWKIEIVNNKMTLTSQNRDIKQEISLKIDFKSNNKLIMSKRIL